MITPLFLLLFSVCYFLMENAAPASFTVHLTRTEVLYFTITTFSTVGYGDIVPMTDSARVVVMISNCPDLVLLGVVVRVFLSAIQMGQSHQVERHSGE